MDTENVVVTKQDRKYKTLVTDIGKEKMTNAILNGKKVNVVMAAVGDGGGYRNALGLIFSSAHGGYDRAGA